MRSAPRFQVRTQPSRVLLIMASSEDSTTAAKCDAASGPTPRPCKLDGVLFFELTFGIVRQSLSPENLLLCDYGRLTAAPAPWRPAASIHCNELLERFRRSIGALAGSRYGGTESTGDACSASHQIFPCHTAPFRMTLKP